MSTTPVPPEHDALRATQQQLDELETLIQRMLTIPVHQLDDEEDLPRVPCLPRETRPVEQVALAQRSPTAVSLASDVQSEQAVADDAPTMASIELAEPGMPEGSASPFDFLDGKALDMPAWDKTLADIDESPPASAPPPTCVKPPRLAWWLWLLITINRAFDRSTRFLRTPGRRIRGQRGRTLLGWTGIVLLGAALAWVVLDWIVCAW